MDSDISFGPNFKVLRKLGEGGNGQVYLALDLKPERKVAIKVMTSSTLSNDEDKERFLEEARLLADLKHKYIVQVHLTHDCETPYYIVMEYVEGCTLAEKEKEQQSHPPQGEELDKRLAFFRKVLDGVKYAHDHKVIHRDLKPSNIMVTESGDPKILDFGIARLEDSSTRTIRGTYRYMAYEHIDGKIKFGKTTDMFALGIILYELVTGRSPYDNPDDDIAIKCQLVEDSFKKPSKFNRDIPRQLDKIIMKLIKKDPQKRYKSVDELLEDWTKLLKDEAK